MYLLQVKTQLQAQSSGQFVVGFQHGHSGMVNALISTYQNQGVRGLWRGFGGIVPRTAVGSAIQMTTFSMSKDFLSKYEVSIHSVLTMKNKFSLELITCVMFTLYSHQKKFPFVSLTDISTIIILNPVGIKYDKWRIFKHWNDSV